MLKALRYRWYRVWFPGRPRGVRICPRSGPPVRCRLERGGRDEEGLAVWRIVLPEGMTCMLGDGIRVAYLPARTRVEVVMRSQPRSLTN